MSYRTRTLAQFLSKIAKTDTCWVWLGQIDRHGYGRFGRRLAHRFSYQLEHEISADLQLDHLCRNKLCVNPAHLEPVTNRTNSLRSGNVSGINARKVICKRGHPLSGNNLFINRQRRRICLTCRRDRWRDYYYRHHESVLERQADRLRKWRERR